MKYMTVDRAFWLAIAGIYLWGFILTLIVVTTVLGNREKQNETIRQIKSTHCMLLVPPESRTMDYIQQCEKNGLP